MAENRDTEHTTVIHTDRRGGGGLIALAVVLLLAIILLYMFRNEIFSAAGSADKAEIDVKVTEGS